MPYQCSILGSINRIVGLDFLGERPRFVPKTSSSYFVTGSGRLYRNAVSDFANELNRATSGSVVARLERIFDAIYIDEFQDLAGYDLDVVELLLRSRVEMLLVGDPRQHTFSTNTASRNKKYAGRGLVSWLRKMAALCTIEECSDSYRCNQAICDFADAIYPDMPATRSVGVPQNRHEGVLQVRRSDMVAYMSEYNPVSVLRYDKNSDTGGFEAMNIGLAKGSTFDRVLVVPTRPMLQYLRDRDPKKLKGPEKLYVAVTRARFSVAFLVPPSNVVPNLPVYEPGRR